MILLYTIPEWVVEFVWCTLTFGFLTPLRRFAILLIEYRLKHVTCIFLTNLSLPESIENEPLSYSAHDHSLVSESFAVAQTPVLHPPVPSDALPLPV